MAIEVKRERDYWTIYVNDNFYCTCDSRTEVAEELSKLEGGDQYEKAVHIQGIRTNPYGKWLCESATERQSFSVQER